MTKKTKSHKSQITTGIPIVLGILGLTLYLKALTIQSEAALIGGIAGIIWGYVASRTG